MLRIRLVDTSDDATKALLRWLQLKTLPGDVPHDVKDGLWWIVEDGDHPVGFAGLVASRRYMGVGYLCRSGILHDYRGRGLQKRLIRVRIAKARRMGWQWLISDTFENPPSANSLIKCGFQTFTPADPWGFKGAIYWRKSLVPKTAVTQAA